MKLALAMAVVLGGCGSSPSDTPSPDGGDPPSGDGATSGLPSSDPFDGNALDPAWQAFNPGRGDVAVHDGKLTIAPHGNALWFAGGSGPLLWKLVTGDVKITAHVHARKTSDASAPPDRDIEVGGLMMRNPTSATENYVFLDVGYAEQRRLGVEHKSTRDGISTFNETASGADAQLRLCRTGATITALRRDSDAAAWQVELTVDRPDLPATLQAGPNASTGQASPDVTISWDEIQFEAVGAGCDR